MSVYDFVSQGTPDDIVERYAALKNDAKPPISAFSIAMSSSSIPRRPGFSQNHDELTQIAAARLECGVVTEWFVTFVNPGKHVPDEVARLTDIHDEDVADAPLPDEARARLVEFVGDATVVAHNAAFDKGFATKTPSGYPLLENLWVDSLDLARIALPRLKSHRLIDLVKAFDAPLSTHRADADVEALCAVYRILLAAIQAMPLDLVEYIAKLAPVEEWPTGAVFGCMASHMTALEEAKTDPGIQRKSYPLTIRGLRSARFAKKAARDSREGRAFRVPGRKASFLPLAIRMYLRLGLGKTAFWSFPMYVRWKRRFLPKVSWAGFTKAMNRGLSRMSWHRRFSGLFRREETLSWRRGPALESPWHTFSRARFSH